jgi:hypothetical protein
VTIQTTRFRPLPFPASARASVLARDAHARRARTRARGLATARAPVLATALWGALVLGVDGTQARTPHAHKSAASAPSTEQILAPSAATVPDALPPERRVWRCGNSYTAHPCADAAGQPLDVADARSDAQRRQSEELAARDKRLAAWYEAGRRERDKAASAPATGRRIAAPAACVDTTMMHCVPKKPRSRTLTTTAASSPAMAAARK